MPRGCAIGCFVLVIVFIAGMIGTAVFLPPYFKEQMHQERLASERKRLDDAIQEIKAGKNFRLQLYDTHETDQLLKRVEGLRGLTHLWLDQTDMTDAGFESIAKAPDLRYLLFRYLDVTDAGIAKLRSSSIEEIDVYWTDSTKYTIAAVTSLPNLRSLTINTYEERNDALLDDLESADQLETLKLIGFRVPDEKIKTMSAKLPNCKIVLTDRDERPKYLRTFLNGEEQ